MPLVFIDYSPLFFTVIEKTPAPPFVRGKFVQIRNDNTEYLVFSPAEFTKYHAGIVERFCLDKGIEGSYDGERKRYVIFDTVWSVVGGGKFELDRSGKKLRLFDESMAYGKFPGAGLAEQVLSLSEFSGFTVLVE